MTKSLTAIALYDIFPDGSAQPVTDPWPASEPAEGAIWRWVHCDRTSQPFAEWAAQHLPPAMRFTLSQAETRPRCEQLGDGLLLTLRGMNLNPGAEGEDMVALRLWATEKLVVTTRFRRLFVIDELRHELAAGKAPLRPAAFVARLADGLAARIEQVSLKHEDATDDIEEILLDDRPDALGTGERQISRLARSVIKMRRFVAPQREALSKLATADLPFINAAEKYDFREVANRTLRTVEELDSTRDRLASLRSHVDSLHSARIGKQGFVLAVVAAIFLPLGFLTGLFGVNVAGMPGVEAPWAFYALSVAMIAIGILQWLLFRWLKWF